MKPIRILLIEDSATDALLLEDMLSQEKSCAHSLTRAGRLEEGLALISRGAFDVALSDLGLPDSQGLATFEALHKKAPQIPIVVLTRFGDLDTGLEAIKMGAQDYLPKNELNTFALVRTLQYAIERQRLTRELQAALAEVKTLSGMLPICCCCKKIRDDTGYWNRIESYLAQHSQATFTHGICPACEIKEREANGLNVPDELRLRARTTSDAQN